MLLIVLVNLMFIYNSKEVVNSSMLLEDDIAMDHLQLIFSIKSLT